MRAIQAVHSAHVEVTLSPRGTGFGTGVDVQLTSRMDVLPGSAIPELISVANSWPCGEHADLMAHIYAGLYALDFEIQKTYENSKLWQE